MLAAARDSRNNIEYAAFRRQPARGTYCARHLIVRRLAPIHLRSGTAVFWAGKLRKSAPSLNSGRSTTIYSIITHVILPGVGSVCPECLSRGHVPAWPLPSGEVYTFVFSEPPSQLEWNVDAGRRLIGARPRRAQRLDPAWLRNWLAERTAITVEHLDHIPADKLDEPAILVDIAVAAPGDVPQPFRILIDGTHRAARKLRDGQDCLAYLLTEQEQSSICTYRVDGQVVELPRLPGPGIADSEAGIFASAATGGDNFA